MVALVTVVGADDRPAWAQPASHPTIGGQPSTEAPHQNAADQQAIRQIEASVIRAIETTKYAVVAISRVRRGSIGDPTDPEFLPNQLACGVVIDPDGLILTTYQVLGRISDNVYYVWAANPNAPLRVYEDVQVLAADPWTDLALLKIQAENLTNLSLAAPGQSVRQGQIAIVLGNPLAMLRNGHASAAWGIIAGTGLKPADRLAEPASRQTQTVHQYGTLLQFDAKLNWETAGSALINMDGQLIGVTSMLGVSPSADFAPGHAIPVDEVFHRAIEALRAGRVPEFGFMGISPRDLSDDLRATGQRGVQIAEVIPRTPAAAAGMQFGEIITKIDNVNIVDADQLMRLISARDIGSKIRVTLTRESTQSGNGKTRTVDLQLAKRRVSTNRPIFESQRRPAWRGLRVDYATAIENIQSRHTLLDPSGCVAIIEVDRDSPAWRAGLRPDWCISHVGQTRVSSPDEFHAAVANLSEQIDVTVTDAGDGKPVRISIAAKTGDAPSDR